MDYKRFDGKAGKLNLFILRGSTTVSLLQSHHWLEERARATHRDGSKESRAQTWLSLSWLVNQSSWCPKHISRVRLNWVWANLEFSSLLTYYNLIYMLNSKNYKIQLKTITINNILKSWNVDILNLNTTMKKVDFTFKTNKRAFGQNWIQTEFWLNWTYIFIKPALLVPIRTS